MVKHLPTRRETQVWSLGHEDPLEKERASHSSTLAWKMSWTEECGGLQSMGSQRVRHDWATSLSLSFTWWQSNAENSPSQTSTVHESRTSDVKTEFTKGSGTRDQVVDIHWIIIKQESSRETAISTLLTMTNPLCGLHQRVENSERVGNSRPSYLPPETSLCRSRSNS